MPMETVLKNAAMCTARTACVLLLCGAVQASDWPTIPLPASAQPINVGKGFSAQGVPMDVRAFVSKQPVEDIARWYRQQWAPAVVENRVRGQTVLGRRVGDYYESVQLEATLGGTRGLVALTRVDRPQQRRDENQARLRKWLSRMPADTRVVSDLSSQDGDKQSLFLVMTNAQSESLNRDRLAALMVEDGYVLEREFSAAASRASAPMLGAPGTGGRTLAFRGGGKEALATIYRDPQGRTGVAVNTIAQREPTP